MPNDLQPGSKAPDLELVGSDGTRRSLVGDISGPAVLYMMRAYT